MGDLIVPFEGAGASSIQVGALASASDIAEDTFVRGKITGPGVEVTGAMIFNHKDLEEHDGKIPETTFLRILPNRVESFMRKFKETCSVMLLSGGSFAKVVVDTSLATGIVEVDHIDRFVLGQKASLDDDNSSPTDVYIIAINVNGATLSSGTGTVQVSATRGGAALDISAYTTAQNAKFYHPGSQASSFTNLRGAFLSAANGGTSAIHGQTKLNYPALQAVNVLGSSVTASNLLDKLLDFYTEVRRRGKGNADTLLMSYKHFGSILKLIELAKGQYKVTATATNASIYGWTEIELSSVRGPLKIVGVQEADDDVILAIDWNSLKFFSNGFIKKRVSPEGRSYFEVRNTTGFQYVVDWLLTGDLMCQLPGTNGVLYGISY